MNKSVPGWLPNGITSSRASCSFVWITFLIPQECGGLGRTENVSDWRNVLETSSLASEWRLQRSRRTGKRPRNGSGGGKKSGNRKKSKDGRRQSINERPSSLPN